MDESPTCLRYPYPSPWDRIHEPITRNCRRTPIISSVVLADSLKPETENELAEYKTVDTAVVTAISRDTKRTCSNHAGLPRRASEPRCLVLI